MPETIGAAIKNIVDATLPSWNTKLITQDEPVAKRSSTYPYITISESFSLARMPASAPGMARFSNLGQIDIWQKRDGEIVEDPTIHLQLIEALEIAQPVRLANGGPMLFRFRPDAGQRLFENVTRIVHHAITVDIIINF